MKEGLKKELGTVQNGTTDLVRARIADRYGVKPDEVKFFEATNPSKEVKVPQDWDVTTRVMKDGRLMDVPVEVSKGIVHESFYETATGSKPPSPEDAAKAAEYAEKAAKFAEQHSVTVTDYRHPEAYGGSNSEGQRIIDKANMGQELRDPGQISKAIEYKSNLAREKALKLESEGKYIEAQGEWMEQARQYKKQFADRIKPEAEAHGGKVPDFIEKGSKILIDVGDGKISPAKGRALLKDMGETPESFIHKSAGLVEAAQTLRPPTGKGPAAPDVVTKNVIDKLELEKLEKAEALRKANAAPVEGTVKPTEEQGGGADKPKTATGEGEGTGKPAPGENGTAAEGEKPPVPVEKGTVAEGEKPLAPGEKGTVTEGEKPPAAEGEQVTGAGEKPPAVTSGTGEGTGNITAGEREVAGGMAKSAALALAQMYADYQVCLAQNKTVEQCKMALGNDIAWGGIIMGGTFLAEGLAGTILAPEAAVVVTTAAAGVGIVMTVKGGYDTAQRFINAPAVAAESGLNQQQKDMLPRFSELVKGVRTDVDTARGLRSQFDSLCDQVNQQAPEAKEVYQNTSALLDQLKGQATLVEKGTGRCSEAAGITAELGALQSSTKDNEGKVNDGLAGARATADNCGSKGDADKIRASYEDCKSLAARMTADAAIAKGRNERLSSIKAEVDVSNADLAAAEEIMDKIGSANTRIHEISSSCISNRDKLNELNDQFVNQKASLGKSIAHLSRLLPDQPPSEVFKAEFQNAYMSVNALKNTFGDFPETLECAFGVADPWGDVTLSSTGLENLFGQAEEAIDSAQNVSTACADIATADAAVDEIGTSADWALYAVGKNEDLLQKADACIAKLDTQKDSVMASAKCPANSTPVWNEQTHDAPCQCNNGYKWDDAGTSCIVDKAEQAAQVEAANCSGTPNSRPYWDEKTSSVRCQYCNKGYHWKGDNGLDCVADIDTGAQVGKSIHSFIDEMAAADAKCMAAGGELDDFGDCQCKDGYKWDDARTKCLVDKAAQLAAWDCSRMPNSTPAWDVVTGAFCQCNKGYKLEGFTKCIVDKQAQVAMADCSGTPNSRPYWDEKANAVRCLYCLQGNHWKDNTGLDCVADNSGGENNHTPSAQGPESAKCVQSKESLRHSIAVYQKQIDCTEEGMRKYGAQIDRRGKTNYWMDCNGNTMYYDLDPRIGIQKTQKYILELQAELNVPCY